MSTITLTARREGTVSKLEGFNDNKGFFIKKFLLDDTMNKNNWQATWKAIRDNVTSFIGQPVVLTPEMDHPEPETQHMHAVGKIVDVGLDPEKHTAWQISEITNPFVQEAIMDKKIRFGSVTITAPEEQVLKVDGNLVVNDVFKGRHDALVDSPAYGDKDVISAVCQGEKGACMKKLLNAAVNDSAIDQATVVQFKKKLSAMNLRLMLMEAAVQPDDQGSRIKDAKHRLKSLYESMKKHKKG